MVFIGFGIAVLYILLLKRHNTKDDENMATMSSEYQDTFELQNRPQLMIKRK
jgi:hypothetical protein